MALSAIDLVAFFAFIAPEMQIPDVCRREKGHVSGRIELMSCISVVWIKYFDSSLSA